MVLVIISADRIILCLLFSISGITLISVSIYLYLSNKKYKSNCLYTTAVIKKYKYGHNSTQLKPYVMFTHNGKEYINEAKVNKFNSRDFPVGTQVKISYLPGKIFFQVMIEEENIAKYSIKKTFYIVLVLGVFLLIIAGWFVFL